MLISFKYKVREIKGDLAENLEFFCVLIGDLDEQMFSDNLFVIIIL